MLHDLLIILLGAAIFVLPMVWNDAIDPRNKRK